jgi:hypothetical protein
VVDVEEPGVVFLELQADVAAAVDLIQALEALEQWDLEGEILKVSGRVVVAAWEALV